MGKRAPRREPVTALFVAERVAVAFAEDAEEEGAEAEVRFWGGWSRWSRWNSGRPTEGAEPVDRIRRWRVSFCVTPFKTSSVSGGNEAYL